MMFDSLTLYMPQERAGTTDLLAQTSGYLDKYETIHKGTLTHCRGSLKNLSIYVSERGVSIRNSLAKYYLGDNIKILTRSDTEQAINQLSDELHLPITQANISALEFGYNFSMDYEPTIYYPYLGACQYFKRLLQTESLYYRNGNRILHFYDKLSEAKSKAVNIPERLKDSNILRYEIRYKRRLGKQLNEPEITAKTLFKEQFYIKLVDRYVSAYKSIYKNVKITELENYFKTELMNTPKDIMEQVCFIGLMAMGQNRFNEFVEECRAKDELNKPEYYSRTKREMRELAEKFEGSESNPLIEELDKKISRVKMNYR